MKVICVTKEYVTNPYFPKLQVGDRATVIDKKRNYGYLYFELAEYPDTGTGRWWWRSESFATLPDPSEEVAIEHEQEAIIYAR